VFVVLSSFNVEPFRIGEINVLPINLSIFDPTSTEAFFKIISRDGYNILPFIPILNFDYYPFAESPNLIIKNGIYISNIPPDFLFNPRLSITKGVFQF